MSTKPPVMIPMRCARNGKPFLAGFRWSDARSLYLLEGTILAENTPKAVVAHSSAGTFSMSQFDMTGFGCPSCRHPAGSEVALPYIHCGQCKGLVCGGRTRNVSGGLEFRCHDGCGHRGNVYNADVSSKGLALGSPSGAVTVTHAVVVIRRP